MDVDNQLELLKQKIDCGKTAPTCVSSVSHYDLLYIFYIKVKFFSKKNAVII